MARKAIIRLFRVLVFAVILICSCILFYSFYQISNKGTEVGYLYLKVVFNIDSEDNIEALTRINTRESDEALVDLVNFYRGEHPGEEIAETLIERGSRVRPLLFKKLTSDGFWRTNIYYTKDRRDSNIRAIIEEIDKNN